MTHKHCFRCKNCGHLEHSGHAGERTVPLKCRVCKKGVVSVNQEMDVPEQQNRDNLKKACPDLFEGLNDMEVGQRWLRLGHNMVAFADHSNWQILADMTAEELKAIDHTLCPEHCERHTPKCVEVHSRPSQAHERAAVDGPGTQDAATV